MRPRTAQQVLVWATRVNHAAPSESDLAVAHEIASAMRYQRAGTLHRLALARLASEQQNRGLEIDANVAEGLRHLRHIAELANDVSSDASPWGPSREG